jgi:molybdenum cofactor cytidylyltransferase
MRVAGLLLTGGRSSRMGQPKALMRLNGETFLLRVLRCLEAGGIDDVIVVMGAHDEAIRQACGEMPLSPGVRLVTNPDPDRGQLSSIIVGLDALMPHHPDAVLVTLVDQPLVRASTVLALTAAFHESHAPVVRPAFEGRHGHPVLFSAEVFPALRAAPAEQGARAVVHAAGPRVCTVAVDDPGVTFDVDTPEDFERAQRAASFEGPPGPLD